MQLSKSWLLVTFCAIVIHQDDFFDKVVRWAQQHSFRSPNQGGPVFIVERNNNTHAQQLSPV